MTVSIDILSRTHFKPEELFHSSIAERRGIDNSSEDEEVIMNLNSVVSTLQRIRNILGEPMIITSGYRCPQLNELVGGAPDSQHTKGEAADFVCPRYGKPEAIVKRIKSEGIEVDQCIIERTKSGAEWIHISKKRNMNRNQFAQIVDGKFTLI